MTDTRNQITLSQEALEARRSYLREWRRKNPDKVRQYEKNRWERAAAKAKEESNLNHE